MNYQEHFKFVLICLSAYVAVFAGAIAMSAYIFYDHDMSSTNHEVLLNIGGFVLSITISIYVIFYCFVVMAVYVRFEAINWLLL